MRALLFLLAIIFATIAFDRGSMEAAGPEQKAEQSQPEGVKIEENRAVIQRGYKAHQEGDKAVITKEEDTKKVTILQCQCMPGNLPCGMIVEPSEVRCETNVRSLVCDMPSACRVRNVIQVP